MNEQHVINVLKAVERHDLYDSIFWRFNEDKIQFFIICSDVFAWGCADLEELNKEDLPLLDQSMKDAGYVEGSLLYCARRRKMRPQGACYKEIKESLWPLFDACGPVREVDSANPRPRPREADDE